MRLGQLVLHIPSQSDHKRLIAELLTELFYMCCAKSKHKDKLADSRAMVSSMLRSVLFFS